MKQNLVISKKANGMDLASVRSKSIREKVLQLIFGKKTRLTILVPEDEIDEITIVDKKDCQDTSKN